MCESVLPAHESCPISVLVVHVSGKSSLREQFSGRVLGCVISWKGIDIIIWATLVKLVFLRRR